jgi:hypothetical protein
MFVWLDECLGPTTESQSPRHLRLALGQGRKKNLTHAGASLRPVGIEKMLRNQSEHFFAFESADEDDIAAIARRFNVSPAELRTALATLPKYGSLYHRLGQPGITAFPPLDPARLKLTGRHIRMP